VFSSSTNFYISNNNNDEVASFAFYDGRYDHVSDWCSPIMAADFTEAMVQQEETFRIEETFSRRNSEIRYVSCIRPITPQRNTEGKVIEDKEYCQPSYAIQQLVIFQDGDIELIARVLWAEARGECELGQLMVAQTILNRLEKGLWGDTIYRVVNSRNQFVVFRGNPIVTQCGINRPYLWNQLLEVADYALNGGRYNADYMILFFRSKVTHNRDWWAPFLGRIGNHAYYGYLREEVR